jgi:hypothetical protein
MILNLFPHLKGYKVLHGSPGCESPETIKAIRTDRIKKSFLTVEFDSGAFTFINKEDFDQFLEDGKVYFQRAAGRLGFEASESLIDQSNPISMP